MAPFARPGAAVRSIEWFPGLDTPRVVSPQGHHGARVGSDYAGSMNVSGKVTLSG